MKKIILCAAILVPLVAHAQWTSDRSTDGNTTITNSYGPNGQTRTTTTQRYGDMTTTSRTTMNGQGYTTTRNCTTQRYGNQTQRTCY